MDINKLNFVNLSEIEAYINKTISEKNIVCSLQLKSSMVLVVMTRKPDVQMTTLEYEFLSEKILGILNSIPNQNHITSAQFYVREEGKSPEWRFVKPVTYIPEMREVVEIKQDPLRRKSRQKQDDLAIKVNESNSDLSKINHSNQLLSIDKSSSRKSVKVYQCLNVRTQLQGRGITQEIQSLYINGKNMANRFKTLHDCLNCLGLQGFYVVSATIETEGVYTHFYTLQRELIMDDVPPLVDIFDELDNISSGVSLEDNLRSLFEGGARFW